MALIEKKKTIPASEVADEIRQLQQIEKGILLDIDAFCKEHDIQYFLGEGTLLGAIRHHGFIPWDDDVDIIMKRADYERFLAIAPRALAEKYEIQHPTTVKNYWSPFIKVRLKGKNQLFHQQHIAHLSENNGPYIDIFPMEYVPKLKSFPQTVQSKYIRYLRGMLSLKLRLRKPRNWKQVILRVLAQFYTVDGIHRRLDRTFKHYGPEPRPYIATLSSYHRLRCQVVPASVYDEAIQWPFEDVTLPVPKDYEQLLTTIYGDYMTLPPEEKRVTHHSYRVYRREDFEQSSER